MERLKCIYMDAHSTMWKHTNTWQKCKAKYKVKLNNSFIIWAKPEICLILYTHLVQKMAKHSTGQLPASRGRYIAFLIQDLQAKHPVQQKTKAAGSFLSQMMNGLSLEPQSCTLLDSFKRKRAPISTCSLDNVVTDVTVHLSVSVKTDTAGSRYSFQFESNANGRRRKLNKTQNRTLRKR